MRIKTLIRMAQGQIAQHKQLTPKLLCNFVCTENVRLCENPLKNNKILISFWQEKNDKRKI